MSASRTYTDFGMLGSLGAATTCGGMAGQRRTGRRGLSGAATRDELLDAALAGNAASVPGGLARGARLPDPADRPGWLDGASITFVALSDIACVSLS